MKLLTHTIPMIALLVAMPIMAQQVDQRIDVKSDVWLKVENMRGKVVIKGTDNNQVWVSGNLDEKATDFIFEKKNNTVVVQVKMPSNMDGSFWDNEDKETNIVIEVPNTAEIYFKGVSSDVEIHNIDSDIVAKTVSGDIVGYDLANKVKLDTVSGAIESRNLSGKVKLSTVSGDIDDANSTGRLYYHAISGDIKAISSAEEVNAQVVSGNLDIQLAQVKDASLSSVSGDLDAKLKLSDDGLLKMSSVSGTVDLALQQGVNADIRVNSNASGRISNKLTNDKVQEAKYGPSSKLETTIGNGSASVKISTVSGDVRLHY